MDPPGMLMQPKPSHDSQDEESAAGFTYGTVSDRSLGSVGSEQFEHPDDDQETLLGYMTPRMREFFTFDKEMWPTNQGTFRHRGKGDAACQWRIDIPAPWRICDQYQWELSLASFQLFSGGQRIYKTGCPTYKVQVSKAIVDKSLDGFNPSLSESIYPRIQSSFAVFLSIIGANDAERDRIARALVALCRRTIVEDAAYFLCGPKLEL